MVLAVDALLPLLRDGDVHCGLASGAYYGAWLKAAQPTSSRHLLVTLTASSRVERFSTTLASVLVMAPPITCPHFYRAVAESRSIVVADQRLYAYP